MTDKHVVHVPGSAGDLARNGPEARDCSSLGQDARAPGTAAVQHLA